MCVCGVVSILCVGSARGQVIQSRFQLSEEMGIGSLFLRTPWHTVDLQCLWRFLNSAHPSIRYPMLFRGIMTPSLMPGGPKVQHILDPSSMSVSFSLSFLSWLAKCDEHCELQDSVNQQEVERMLLFGLFLKSACHELFLRKKTSHIQRALQESMF